MNNQNIHSLATTGNNVFAGTDSNGVYLSTNNGLSWTQKNQGFGFAPRVYSLLIANNYIFAGTYYKSAWRRSLAEIIEIQNISTKIPSSFSLSQNYPNPFNPTTNIKFDIAKNGFASIKIYDILGKEVATLVNENLKSGTYEVTFDGSDLSSGTYFYQLRVSDFVETKRMVLIK